MTDFMYCTMLTLYEINSTAHMRLTLHQGWLSSSVLYTPCYSSLVACLGYKLRVEGK